MVERWTRICLVDNKIKKRELNPVNPLLYPVMSSILYSQTLRIRRIPPPPSMSVSDRYIARSHNPRSSRQSSNQLIIDNYNIEILFFTRESHILRSKSLNCFSLVSLLVHIGYTQEVPSTII
jgi:hypothetical protein